MTAISWKAEVIADNSGKWVGNMLRFATADEAATYVADLSMRWMLVRATRVVESEDPVNYRIRDGEVMKVPYMAVVGKREAEAGTVAVRARGAGKKQEVVSVTEFIDRVRQESVSRAL